jgi:diguanylate cyclase (GGDEF)-like protein
MITNRILHRDGRWVWVEVTLRALRDGERGLPRGIIGSLRDISARKAIEQELEEANRRLEALAGKDALTGLANRRTFDDVLDKEYRRARRERKSLSLIMIDVDHFKAFNDHYGHPEGDECLRRVAAAIQATVRRPGDMVARYGGEEFAVILPSTPESGAATIADLIRDSVLKLRLPHQNIPSQMLTISCGVAATESFDRRPTSLVKLADRALYQAKENGRNRVIQASKLLAIVASKSSASA